MYLLPIHKHLILADVITAPPKYFTVDQTQKVLSKLFPTTLASQMLFTFPVSSLNKEDRCPMTVQPKTRTREADVHHGCHTPRRWTLADLASM